MEGLKLQQKDRAWQQDASPQKEEKPRKQVQFEMDEGLAAELDLSADLTHFLTEGAAPDQKDIPSSTARLHTSTKSSHDSLALPGGSQSSSSSYFPSIPDKVGKRGQTLSAIPANGFPRNCLNPTTLTPTGGRI